MTTITLVTGASRGLGRNTAIAIARRGGDVIVTYHSRREEADAVVTQIVGLGRKRFGRIDVLVNNAGIGPISRFDTLRVDDWNAMIDTNFKGMLYGFAATLPVFSRQRSGHVINVLSTAGLKVLPTMGVYAATKNAMRTATEALRQEAGPYLRVTEISPGFVDTDFSDTVDDPGVRAAISERKREIAIGPDAIARAIAFAIEQPADVEIGSIVVRPTAQD